MAILSNPQEIDTPAPGPQRYGLFNAATVLDNLDARGIASGFQFAAEGCGNIYGYDANCETHDAKTFDEGLGYIEASPYWGYATRQCGTVGLTPERVTASVRNKLLSLEQTFVEGMLWGGSTLDPTPTLTDATGVTSVTPAGGGAGAAIAALEASFYSEYGYAGVIHVNQQAYAAIAYSQLIERQGGALRTPLGSAWSFGAGYGITGPADDAPDAGSVWAFMTPPVLVRRSSEILVPDVLMTMDRVQNQYMALAERVYAHAWLCDVIHAVQVPVAAPAVETGV